MDMNLLARRALLSVAGNRTVSRLATRYGMRLGASRFVAGETLDQAMASVRELNRQGISATLDHLGEAVTDAAEAGAAADSYLELLDAIAGAGVDANVSLKLTAMGLAIDRELARANLLRVVERAAKYENFVRIDMEDSPYTQATLELFESVWADHKNLGTVIQAYLYRSEADLARLTALGASVRLVKGAYKEPESVAWPRKADVDANFRKLIRQRLESGVYTAIATHDEGAINYTRSLAAEQGIGPNRFEFQMLYGIRTGLQRELASAGYRVRIYVPYGRQWYPYFVRRLAERPANVLFVLRNLLRG